MGRHLASKRFGNAARWPGGRLLLGLLGLLPAVPLLLPAQSVDTARLADSLRAIVTEGIHERAFPGAQVLVLHRGKVLFHEAFGYHTYDSLRPVQPDHLYDLASITKVSGPLPALMLLFGQGRFDPDAPLKQYLPHFRRSNKARLTFREMLAHQARLRPWIPYWQGTLKGHARYPWQKRWDAARTNDGRFRTRTLRADSSRRFPIRITDSLWLHRRFAEKRIYKAIRKSPLLEEAGYRYSGLLFYLLPGLIEQLSGQDYRRYLQEEIYRPIGARTLGYRPLERFPRSRIVPTERDTFFRRQLLHGVVHDEGAALMNGVSGNAGLFGTAEDLGKLMQLYLQRGIWAGDTLLRPEVVDQFTTYQYPGNRRGLGFDKPPLKYVWGQSYIAPGASPRSFGHAGYTGTFAWGDPEAELVFVFLSNRVYPTRLNRKLYQMNLRPRMHRAVYRAVGRE